MSLNNANGVLLNAIAKPQALYLNPRIAWLRGFFIGQNTQKPSLCYILVLAYFATGCRSFNAMGYDH